MKPSVFSRKVIPAYIFPTLFFLLFFILITRSIPEARESAIFDKKNAPVVLQLKWFHQFQFAGYYAALHKGFFEDEGLDVIIKAGGPKVKVDEEVVSGRASYGVLASELIQKKAQGKPLVLLAAIMQHSIRAIIVRADSGINSPSDFVGQRIMINRNEDAEFTAMFVAEGVPLNKLNIISKDKTANNKFIKGEIDGLNGSIGNQPFVFQDKGIPVKTIRPISYGIDFYGDSLFTSETERKKHPDRVAAFRRAAIRGWEYAMAHDSEIIDLIIAEYNATKDRAHLQFEADAMHKLILPQLVDIGHISSHRIERMAQLYASQKVIPQNFSLDGFIYDPTPATNKRFLRLLLTGFSVLVFVAVVCSATLIYFNKKLRKLVYLRTRELTFVNENLLKAIETRKKAEEEIKRLQGLLPICMHCKKIRDDQGVWNQIEQYINERSDVTFSHGCCPDCLTEYYPEYTSLVSGNDSE